MPSGEARKRGRAGDTAALIPNFPSAHVPVWSVFAGFTVSALVGLVFGVFPAARASRLDPIESLRYE